MEIHKSVTHKTSLECAYIQVFCLCFSLLKSDPSCTSVDGTPSIDGKTWCLSIQETARTERMVMVWVGSGPPATGSKTVGHQPLVQRQQGTSHRFKHWGTSHWFNDSGAPATGSKTAQHQPLVQRQQGISHWFKDSGALAPGSKTVGHQPLVQRQWGICHWFKDSRHKPLVQRQQGTTGSKTAGHYWFKDSGAILVQRQRGTSHWFKDSGALAPGSKTVGNQPLTGSKTKDMFVVQDLRVHMHIREGSVWWGKGEGTAVFHHCCYAQEQNYLIYNYSQQALTDITCRSYCVQTRFWSSHTSELVINTRKPTETPPPQKKEEEVCKDGLTPLVAESRSLTQNWALTKNGFER